MHRYGVETAAALSGFPRNSLGQMVARERIPGFPYEPADLCSLALARKLTLQGMEIQPACAIAFGARDAWTEVVVNDGELGGRSQFIVVARSEPGAPAPYTWALSPSGDELIEFIAKADERGAVFIVNVGDIARAVLLGLLDAKPSTHGVTSNGTLKIKAKRRVRARSRARL